jgi:hypothetical protein
MKFKIGDTVMLTEDVVTYQKGEVGVIHSSQTSWDWKVRFSTGRMCAFHEHELEHARIANTEITRKLYPHYKEEGEWLIITEKTT